MAMQEFISYFSILRVNSRNHNLKIPGTLIRKRFNFVKK